MAKADMTIQINVSAPGLEAAITALTDAIKLKNGEAIIPEGTALKVEGIKVAPKEAPKEVAETSTQTQTPEPVSAPAPAPIQEPVPAPKQITLDDICTAGAKLVEDGKLNLVIGLLGKYGVQAVNQIQPDRFSEVAADLRALGAEI